MLRNTSKNVVCHVCKEMRQCEPLDSAALRLDWDTCVLCNRFYCYNHRKVGEKERVCEIDHKAYYLKYSQHRFNLYEDLAQWRFWKEDAVHM